MHKKAGALYWVLLAIVAAIAAPNIISLIRGPAQMPDVFADQLTLADAREQAQAQDKPVLVLVTADWCPPCQALKRGTLTDESVAAWINENTVPVYLEDGANPDEISMFPLRSYPTTFVIHEDSIVTAVVGNESPDEYVRKLEKALGSSS